MPGLLPDVDPDGLLEYSVVFTDRSLNHMSQRFQRVMCDISGILKHVYNAHSAVVVPGGGTYGMEAVARQFATGKKCLVIRNGWFSYRWTQIFDAGKIPADIDRAESAPGGVGKHAPFAPAPIDEVVASIRANSSGRGVRAARRDRVGNHSPRRVFARGRRRRPRDGRTVRPRLRRLGRAVGRHGGLRCRRVDHRAAKRLEQHARFRARDAEPPGTHRY